MTFACNTKRWITCFNQLIQQCYTDFIDFLMKKFKQIASLISSNEKLGIKEIDKMYKMYQTK